MPAWVHEGQVMSTKPRKCFKCRGEGKWQWRICSDGPWRWICDKCDDELNYLAARWAYGPDKAIKMLEKYRARKDV